MIQLKKYILIPFCLFFSSMTYADVVVIVNADNAASIDAASVKKIFLGKSKTFSDGSSAIPINLTGSDEVRTDFNSKVLGKKDSQVKAIWSRLIFSGRATPPKELSGLELVEFVSKNKDAIGYVEASVATDAVKAISF